MFPSKISSPSPRLTKIFLTSAVLTLLSGFAGTAIAAAHTVTLTSPANKAINCIVSVNKSMLLDDATDGAATVEIAATINPRAARGNYTLTLECSSHQIVRLHVHVRATRGHKSGTLISSLHFQRLNIPITTTAPATTKTTHTTTKTVTTSPLTSSPFLCTTAECPIIPVTITPDVTEAAINKADELWSYQETGFTEQMFHTGQCVELADAKRPDIVARVEEVAIAKRIMAKDTNPYPSLEAINWDAQFWDSNAAAAGMNVGSAPEAGAIMVFHNSEYNHETGPGHVAYVNSVEPNGDVTVTEEHAPELWAVHNQTFTPEEIQGENIDYIYQEHS